MIWVEVPLVVVWLTIFWGLLCLCQLMCASQCKCNKKVHTCFCQTAKIHRNEHTLGQFTELNGCVLFNQYNQIFCVVSFKKKLNRSLDRKDDWYSKPQLLNTIIEFSPILNSKLDQIDETPKTKIPAFEPLSYWSSVRSHSHYSKLSAVGRRHRKAFSSLQSCLTGSSWIGLIWRIQHKIGKSRMLERLVLPDKIQRNTSLHEPPKWLLWISQSYWFLFKKLSGYRSVKLTLRRLVYLLPLLYVMVTHKRFL